MRSLWLFAIIALIGCEKVEHTVASHEFELRRGPSIWGNGVMKEESRAVTEFNKIVVGDTFQVVASELGGPTLKVTADSNLLSHIRTSVKDKVLTVVVDDSISRSRDFKVIVNTPKIDEFDASGVANAHVNLRSAHTFKLKERGEPRVLVNGPMTDLTCELYGAGSAEFTAKKLDKANVNLSGTTMFLSKASIDSLDAELSGASNMKGGMNGIAANLRLSGSSYAAMGRFKSVEQTLKGTSRLTVNSNNYSAL